MGACGCSVEQEARPASEGKAMAKGDFCSRGQLAHFRNEAVSLGDRAFHIADQLSNIDFYAYYLSFKGTDSLRVQVVLEKEGLVSKFVEHGV